MAQHLLLEVELEDAPVTIRRLLRVPASLTLAQLHPALQAAMGWQDCHLYQFVSNGKYYMPQHALDEAVSWGGIDADRAALDSAVTIGEMLPRLGNWLLYEYDFGDDWRHRITLIERSIGSGEIILEGAEGCCPPEDVGGVHGYAQMLEAFSPGGDRQARAEYEQWLGVKSWSATAVDFVRLAEFVALESDILMMVERSHSIIARMRPPATTTSAPILSLVTTLLLNLADGPIKLTKKGWLPTASVQALIDAWPDKFYWSAEYVVDDKTHREEEVNSVWVSRKIAQHAGLIKVVKGQMMITANGIKSLGPNQQGSLYQRLLLAGIQKFRWHNLDSHSPFPAIQQSFLVMLELLAYHQDPLPIDFIAQLLLKIQPSIYAEIEPVYDDAAQPLAHAIKHRVGTLGRIFALIDCMPLKSEDEKLWTRHYSLEFTALGRSLWPGSVL